MNHIVFGNIDVGIWSEIIANPPANTTIPELTPAQVIELADYDAAMVAQESRSVSKETAKLALKADAMMQQLENASVDGINNYVDNNVNNLADVKRLLKLLLLQLQIQTFNSD